MNAIVKLERSAITEEGMREYTFTTSSSLKLDKDKTYVLDLKEKKPKRTLAQNDMFNSLVNKIAIEQDGNLKDRQVYHDQILKMAGVESKIHKGIYTADELEKMLRLNDISACKILSKKVANHKMYYLAELYEGSRNYDTAEMTKLIDAALDYATELGIETDYWRSLLDR